MAFTFVPNSDLDFQTPNGTPSLRLGVAGCGRVFERLHLKALQKCSQWQLVAACDPLVDRRDWIRRELPDVAVSKELNALLSENQPDAVLVSAPPELHYELSLESLKAGCHVVVEKPMALNTVHAEAMWQTAVQHKKRLLVGFNRRFRKPYREMKKRLAGIGLDAVGAITHQLILTPTSWKPITPFLQDDFKGGGVLEDVLSHQSDLLAWMLDASIERVRARSSLKKGTKVIEVDMVFANRFEATCFAGHGPTYMEIMVLEAEPNYYMAHPTGILSLRSPPSELTGFYCRLLNLYRAIYHRITKRPSTTEESMEFEWRALAQALRRPNRPTVCCDGACGLMTVEVVDACQRSLKNGSSWQNVTERCGANS
jgi:predicted dehydrogenase